MRHHNPLLTLLVTGCTAAGFVGWGAVPGPGFLSLYAQQAATQPAPGDDGVSVLGRGPVHEAFADPVLEQPAASRTVPNRQRPSRNYLPRKSPRGRTSNGFLATGGGMRIWRISSG
jgi:hypothetical protein